MMEPRSISPPKRRKPQYPQVWDDDQLDVEAFSFDGTVHGVFTTTSPNELLSTAPHSSAMGRDDLRQSFKQGRKRSIGSFDLDGDLADEREQLQRHPSKDFSSHEFPYFGASVPSKENRVVNYTIQNPFNHGSNPRHPFAREIIVLKQGATNGYVKFCIKKDNPWATPTPTQYPNPFRLHRGTSSQSQIQKVPNIPRLPDGFGGNMICNSFDQELWKFYYTAFCAGRTLLSGTNLFLVDFAKMAFGNDCVMHAVLSLAATYVLDYTQGSQWRERANFHYKEATRLLTLALEDKNTHEIGKEDAVVSAMIILTCEDIITWELRRSKHETQRWLEGVRSAIELLDQCNPGYHFNNSVNVQNSAVRTSNGNLIASFDIVARPVMPLDSKNVGSNFMWLLNGTPREQSRIHGGTGVSPKLLHILSQITSRTVIMGKEAGSRITPRAVVQIEKMLLGIRQWSEISNGFPSEHELLAACDLDVNGLVSTPEEVTDLTAQAWVSAAQIYLQCRFYRRPRSHPLVKAPLDTLLRCVERMPCAGSLFTSQSPFFPIFIMGAVSETEEERNVARHWFETVVEGLGSRSSVPPVWKALQYLWIWIDENPIEDHENFDGPIKERKAWWEEMVNMLMSTFGVLSLC